MEEGMTDQNRARCAPHAFSESGSMWRTRFADQRPGREGRSRPSENFLRKAPRRENRAKAKLAPRGSVP